MKSDHRAWVHIDLGALLLNGMRLAERAGVPLLPMVKSDAYGLGVQKVVPVLEQLDPWGYGVATMREGAELREIGITRPVVVFTPILASDFDELRAHRLTPTFGDSERIFAWHSSGGGAWHLAIDTGMSRAGIRWTDAATLRDDLLIEPPEGAFTHFHSADANDGSIDVQQERFRAALDQLPARPKYLHAENSPAIERQAPSPWDLARPGVLLYGVGGGEGSGISPRNVASLHGRIVETRELQDGDTVSYGATWRAQGKRRIATVSAGYADGIRRSLSNRGVALVNGKRVPIAGVVTMDMTMLDVTDADCKVGDVATFLGKMDGGELPIAEVAEAAGLSPYEILVGLRLRAARTYSGAPA
jgi:alanine racemase